MPGYRVQPTIFQSGTPLEKFCCPICNLLLRDAVQPSCGHWLCQTCAEGLFASESPPRCPRKDCGVNLTPEEGANYFPDRFVRREILILDVVCAFMTKGCNWKGKFSNFETHLETCPYVFIDCHQNVPASEMDAHSSACLEVAQPCPLAPLGCKKTGLVSDIQSHIAEELASHVTMLAVKVIQVSESVRKLEEQQIVPFHRMEAAGGSSTDVGYTSLPDCNNDVKSDGKLEALGGTKVTELQTLVGHVTMLTSKTLEPPLQRPDHEGSSSVYGYNSSLHHSLNPLTGSTQMVTGHTLPLPVSESAQESVQEKQECSQGIEVEEGVSLDCENNVVELYGKLRPLGNLLPPKETANVGNSTLQPADMNEIVRQRDEEIATLRTSKAALEKLLHAKSAEIEDRDFRLSLIENSNHDGSMIWKIPQFSQRMNDAQSGKYTSIFSLPFYTGRYGYKMCLRLYILGDGIGINSHMSLFFLIMRGEFDNILQWPFTHKVTLKLLNQTGARDVIDTFQPDPMSSSFRKPKSDMNVASGCPRFVAHQELKNGGFIVDDTIFIKCIIDRTTMRNP